MLDDARAVQQEVLAQPAPITRQQRRAQARRAAKAATATEGTP
jgi:hypothetical protein